MSIKIIMNNPGILGPGDPVTGKVICTFNEEEHIRGIQCKFRGEEQSHWTERSGKSRVHYRGKNDFVTADTNFIGEVTMNPGVYEYTFAYALPPSDVPSSFVHRFGSIRYFIQANIDRPFAFDYKDEVTLHVASPIALNSSLQNSQPMPVTSQVEKEVGCLCWASPPVTLDVTLNRDSYVLGETINFKVHLNNRSNQDIQKVRVELASNIEFKAYIPGPRHKFQKNLIAITEDFGTGALSEKSYTFDLKIPQTALITNFANCGFLKEWYTLEVIAVFPPFYNDLVLQSNIKLGHCDFGLNRTSGGSMANIAPTAPTCPANVDPLPPSYNDVMKKDGPP